MLALRQFWFPMLLAAVGIVSMLFAGSSTGNGRRAMLTVAIVLFFLAALSYVWGDPVRGPFAYLTHPGSPEKFSLHAGIECTYQVSALKDGIDLSRCVRFGQGPQPIRVWMQRTWWPGLQVRATLMGASGRPFLVFNNKRVEYAAEGIDVNHDDYAFEAVQQRGIPIFQVIITKNLGAIYINAVWESPDGKSFTMLRGDDLDRGIPIGEAKNPEFRLHRIFKYPSYLYPGERE